MGKGDGEAAGGGEDKIVGVGFRWRPDVRDALTVAAQNAKPRTSASRLAESIVEAWLEEGKYLKPKGKSRR
jgi:hypothetical protein